MKPYYSDDAVTLYHGDALEVGALEVAAVVCVTDPPYGETSLTWDHWPEGWPALLSSFIDSLWCFGSMRTFLDHRDDFAGWKFAQDIVWEKHNGSGFATDRFRRVRENATHWYRGDWGAIHHGAVTITGGIPKNVRRRAVPADVHGDRGESLYVNDGTRYMRSVIYERSGHRFTEHPTEKPLAVLEPLITYSCPLGLTVLDPFAGSGSTLVAAKRLGRRAVGIEIEERYCEIAARRCSQGVLDFDAPPRVEHAGDL